MPRPDVDVHSFRSATLPSSPTIEQCPDTRTCHPMPCRMYMPPIGMIHAMLPAPIGFPVPWHSRPSRSAGFRIHWPTVVQSSATVTRAHRISAHRGRKTCHGHPYQSNFTHRGKAPNRHDQSVFRKTAPFRHSCGHTPEGDLPRSPASIEFQPTVAVKSATVRTYGGYSLTVAENPATVPLIPRISLTVAERTATAPSVPTPSGHRGNTNRRSLPHPSTFRSS